MIEAISREKQIELVRAIKRGDRKAGEALIKQYERLAFKVAREMDPEILLDEDKKQEIFTEIWRVAFEFDETRGASYSTYVAKCIRNYVRTQKKKKNAKKRRAIFLYLDEPTPYFHRGNSRELKERIIVDESQGHHLSNTRTDKIAETNSELQYLYYLIKKEDIRGRAGEALYFKLQGMDNIEIAKAMNTNSNNVSSLLDIAYQKIRKRKRLEEQV